MTSQLGVCDCIGCSCGAPAETRTPNQGGRCKAFVQVCAARTTSSNKCSEPNCKLFGKFAGKCHMHKSDLVYCNFNRCPCGGKKIATSIQKAQLERSPVDVHCCEDGVDVFYNHGNGR